MEIKGIDYYSLKIASIDWNDYEKNGFGKLKYAKIIEESEIDTEVVQVGNIVKVSGEIFETNYKDKNNNWVNDYTISLKRFENKEGELH